jgi:hypothetical protein
MTEVAANVRRTVTVNRTDAKKLNIGECFLEFILSPIRGAKGYRVKTMGATSVPAHCHGGFVLMTNIIKVSGQKQGGITILTFWACIIPDLLNSPVE